ncbi:hypothetical protein MNBD_GAMMA15-448 [hydrothermal vent metagenome]|uniref:Uncharacterized protein n=1 Tax=hydrothermal vent metagenome TaxID=652676 RepID=A0A3B0YKE6_9ZZZZ
MKETDFRIERILHAYVDDELGPQEKSRLLVKLESDESIRDRACELQLTKEWIKCSFEGETAPTRTVPGLQHRLRQASPFGLAASLLIVLLAFSAGWISYSLKDGASTLVAMDTLYGETPHVILHISDSDEARFNLVLARTSQILHKYENTGVQIEVVANAGGLDFMRTASSQHIEHIKQIISQYDNVRFIACSRGLEKLRERGLDASVIEGIDAHEPAADHLIERLTHGWSYIRI